MHQLMREGHDGDDGLFGAVMFVACIVYGLLVPALHNAANTAGASRWQAVVTA